VTPVAGDGGIPSAVLFPLDPLRPARVDPAFAAEAEAAEAAGFSVGIVDHDKLDRTVDGRAAIGRTAVARPCRAVYRGWMMSVEAYAALHTALAADGVEMIVRPCDYEACHHAPGALAAMARWMPQTRIAPGERPSRGGSVDTALDLFRSSPVMVKDYVKSQAAGYWSEACYIPDSSARESAWAVVDRFVELQGGSVTGGIVFKEYRPLVRAGSQAAEWRAFSVLGSACGCWPRSPDAAALPAPPHDLVAEAALSAPGPFVSLDFGVEENGRWWLIEIGDGQVSELPEGAAEAIYRSLRDAGRP
jgi:hypothetical protein